MSYFNCLPTVNVLWLFLTVPWVGLKCAIVVLPDHTHLLFYMPVHEVKFYRTDQESLCEQRKIGRD